MNKTNFFENDKILTYDKLTFSLEELSKTFCKVLNFTEANKVISYQNFIRLKEREKFMDSGFLTSSSNIVEFLEKTLGLELDRLNNNHKRNQLNLMIKKLQKPS
ncbi:hypothetical protein [Lactovum miscens]|uniref:Uncharacterized protein n=1 Tax=Lactovum miscens TaxID=190387 RepID=A0A841C5S4_9LACT|nr:hypothetical protein [Lactovum miscens]MBB5887627.1 hypothetical protein [Lactovum miscens]